MEPNLLDIATDWSFYDRPVPSSVLRGVDLPSELSPELGLIIQGVRRCGKSTLMSQLIERYGLDRGRCTFVNFEDPRLAGALHFSTLDDLIKSVQARRPDGEPETYFLDEIQVVDGWERWLRSQLDRKTGSRFVLSGSNASLLSGELGSSLTGRHLTVELFPFDFAEYRQLHPAATLDGWLHSGGFPAPAQTGDGDRLLRSYFSDIIERDMRERVGARSSLPLKQLVQIVYESAGSELSARRLSAAVGISTDTATLYLQAAESAYLILPCPFFAWSERKRASRRTKYYPIDNGLWRVSVTRSQLERGKALECAVFLELKKRFGDVYYWSGKGEVDFVVLVEGEPQPIQVTWDEPRDRHGQALDAFYEEHRMARESIMVNAQSFGAGMPELT